MAILVPANTTHGLESKTGAPIAIAALGNITAAGESRCAILGLTITANSSRTWVGNRPRCIPSNARIPMETTAKRTAFGRFKKHRPIIKEQTETLRLVAFGKHLLNGPI